MKTKKQFKSGYAAIIGKPNVGKSTLLNRLVMQKIAAISSKPQTTRNKITGVVHFPGGQIILVDTPGIHKASSQLNRQMVRASLSTYHDVELILFVIDAKQGFAENDVFVLDTMKKAPCPKILIVNKIDLVPKPSLLELIAKANERAIFAEILPISALHSDGLEGGPIIFFGSVSLLNSFLLINPDLIASSFKVVPFFNAFLAILEALS